jgi:CobQ-like glutamine amidotransferase family enzyme
MIYLEGKIVDKNERLARQWLQKSADEKYEKAIEVLKGIA